MKVKDAVVLISIGILYGCATTERKEIGPKPANIVEAINALSRDAFIDTSTTEIDRQSLDNWNFEIED